MNREIKFRTWDNDNECLDFFDFSDLDKVIETLDSFRDYFSPSYFTDRGEEKGSQFLMQYTGLKDKNSKEIYESDVLHNTEYGHKFIIQWGMENESYAGWAGKWIGSSGFISPLYNAPLVNCEVIGNIFQNPELRK